MLVIISSMLVWVDEATAVTPAKPNAKPQEPKDTPQCPDGYVFNGGTCQADPIKGFGSSPYVSNQAVGLVDDLINDDDSIEAAIQ
jgi:hypothetical protein